MKKGTEIKFSLNDLFFFPVMVPIKGFKFILEQLQDMVDKELYDKQALQRRLLELEMEYELGNVEEGDYWNLRNMITGRLRWIIQREQE